MRRRFLLTKEELAVQELEDKTIQAEGSMPKVYDQFIQKTEEEATEEREELVKEAEEEEASGDLGMDADMEDEIPEINDPDVSDPTDSQEEIKAEEVTTESLFGDKANNFVSSTIPMVMAGLAALGIKYTPQIAGLMFKGVIWLFSRIGSLTETTARAIIRYAEQNRLSADKLSNRLDHCRAQLRELAEEGGPADRSPYVDRAVINTLKVGANIAFEHNIRVATDNLRKLIAGLTAEAEQSYEMVSKLAALSPDKAPKSISSYMEVSVAELNLEQGTLEGYLNQSGEVVQYKSRFHLPGDAVFLFNAPQVKNQDIDGVVKAYKAASALLAVDPASVKVITEVPSLGAHDLVRVVAATEKLLVMIRSLDAYYRQLHALQPSVAYSVKKLFLQLADQEAKARMSNSFIEPMYLKSNFASGVLISTIMELSGYSSRVAAASIKLVEDHLRKMS